MRITDNDLAKIGEFFGCKNHGWTREALAYVGLKPPLKAGWKGRLLSEGVSEESAFAFGVSMEDFLWIRGKDIHPEDIEDKMKYDAAMRVKPEAKIREQLDALEIACNDLRKSAEDLRNQVKKMRSEMSEDDF